MERFNAPSPIPSENHDCPHLVVFRLSYSHSLSRLFRALLQFVRRPHDSSLIYHKQSVNIDLKLVYTLELITRLAHASLYLMDFIHSCVHPSLA